MGLGLGRLRLAPALLIAAVLARPSSAGVEVGSETGLASQYIWRGLTVVNRPVLQPSLWASGSLGDFTATLSLWSSLEIGRYDGSSDLSESNGSHAFDLTESDPSFELAYSLGDSEAEVAAGISGYLYPNASGLTMDDSAAEVYGRVTLPPVPVLGVVSTFSAYQDVTAIDGTYLEAGLSRTFAIRDRLDLVASAAAGWNHGQSVRYDASGAVKEPGNFAHDGFTHWELGAALPVGLGSFTLEPSAHVIFGRDEYAKIWSATENRDVKYWFGITLSTTRTLVD